MVANEESEPGKELTPLSEGRSGGPSIEDIKCGPGEGDAENLPGADQSEPGLTEKSIKGSVYRLKSMVAMRLLAEATVFILLLLLPLVILVLGKFAALTITVKILLISLALVALLILPVYTQVTYQVKVTADELITYSLAARRSCRLASIKTVKRRSSWGVIRFILESDSGELSFPIWLNDCQGLVARLRALNSGAAGGAGGGSIFRTFKQDPVGLAYQMGQSALSLLFAGLAWYFVLTMHRGGHQSSADMGLLYSFAMVVSAVLTWRAWVVAMMPREVEIKPDELLISTVFRQIKVGWENLRGVTPPFPLLPEGFIIRTTKGSFLVGQGMDEADELEAALKANFDRVKSLRSGAPQGKN